MLSATAQGVSGPAHCFLQVTLTGAVAESHDGPYAAMSVKIFPLTPNNVARRASNESQPQHAMRVTMRDLEEVECVVGGAQL